MEVLTYLLGVGAAAAWISAVVNALLVVGLAPKGAGLSTLFNLGWWRFEAIERRSGEAVRAPIRRYRLSFYAFFACVLGNIAVTFALIQQSQTAA